NELTKRMSSFTWIGAPKHFNQLVGGYGAIQVCGELSENCRFSRRQVNIPMASPNLVRLEIDNTSSEIQAAKTDALSSKPAHARTHTCAQFRDRDGLSEMRVYPSFQHGNTVGRSRTAANYDDRALNQEIAPEAGKVQYIFIQTLDIDQNQVVTAGR